jgi:hypothetical protein
MKLTSVKSNDITKFSSITLITIMILLGSLSSCGGASDDQSASYQIDEDEITEEHYELISATSLDVDAVYAEYQALLLSNTLEDAKAALLTSLKNRDGVASAFISADKFNITINYANGLGAVLETEFIGMPDIASSNSTLIQLNTKADHIKSSPKQISSTKALSSASFGSMNYGLFLFPFHYEQTMACQSVLTSSDPNYANCDSTDSYPFPNADFEQVSTLTSYYADPQLPGVSYAQKFLDSDADVETFRGIVSTQWSSPAHIVVAAHGGVRNIGESDQYAIIALHDSLDETLTPTTVKDLLSGRLVILQLDGSSGFGIPASKRLAVTPSFIQYYSELRAATYPSSNLSAHYFFWSCYGFDAEMKSAILDSGAAASFAGFTGKVTRSFSTEVALKFFKDQANSNAVKETLSSAISPNQCDPDNPTTCFSAAIKDNGYNIFDPIMYFHKAFVEITDGQYLSNPNPPAPQKLESSSAGSLKVIDGGDMGFSLGAALVEPGIYPPVGIAATWSISFDNTSEGSYSMDSSDLVSVQMNTTTDSWEASLFIQENAREHNAVLLADECYAKIDIIYSDDHYIIGSIDAVMLNSDYSNKLGIKGTFYAIKTNLGM